LKSDKFIDIYGTWRFFNTFTYTGGFEVHEFSHFVVTHFNIIILTSHVWFQKIGMRLHGRWVSFPTVPCSCADHSQLSHLLSSINWGWVSYHALWDETLLQ